MSLVALLLSVVLLVVAVVMAVAGGSAERRARRDQAERDLESERSQTEEAESARGTITAAESYVGLLPSAVTGGREVERIDGELLAVDRQVRDAGIADNIDEYNRLVGVGNALLDEHDAQVDALNAAGRSRRSGCHPG